MKNNTFFNNLSSEDKIRSEAIKTLYKFMSNTGRFSLLVTGERGTGKTRWIKQIVENLKEEKIKWCNKIVIASCASFSNDTMAEAELFGYNKGAFTGANEKGYDGLFKNANGHKFY